MVSASGLQSSASNSERGFVWFLPISIMATSAANLNAVRETMDVLLEISRILNTGLDMETLSICVRLCEQGINPEALSAVIKELRKATEALKAAENMTG
ncbi:mitotic-spindle organizing protein 1 [Rhineura floridana]|uniref:mitotic-spindle organizing protein 1 n=1 Tax=Rhineura floridana TaxID=261503 RepID=UPI002AC85509|nr:mitotic-spindle organizing protein 1 [Rhineura floridana]